MPLPEDWRGSASVYAARLGSVVVGALTSALVARMLLPAGQGDYATVLAGADMAAQVANLGLSSSLLVEASRSPSDVRRMIRVSGVFIVGAFLSLAILWPLVRALFPGEPPAVAWWPVWVAWVPIRISRLHSGALLTALRGYGPMAGLEFFGRLASACFGLGSLYLLQTGLTGFLVALVVADVLVAVAGYVALLSLAPPASRNGPGLAPTLLRVGLRAYPLLVLPWLLIRSDVLLTRAIRGSAEAGLYSVASQVIDLALLLPLTLASFSVPKLTREAGAVALLPGTCRLLTIYVLTVSLLVAIVGKPGLRLMFGDAYGKAWAGVLLLLPGFLALSIEMVLAQFYAVRGFPAFLTHAWLAAFVLNLALNLVLLPRFGFLAAAGTSSVGYIVVCFVVVRRFQCDTGIPWRRLFVKGVST